MLEHQKLTIFIIESAFVWTNTTDSQEMGIQGIVRLYLFRMCAILVLEFTKFLIIFAIESKSIPIRRVSGISP